MLGAVEPGERVLNGRLEDVRFYGRALADNEIPALLSEPQKPDPALVGRWTSRSLAVKQWGNLARADLPAEYVVRGRPDQDDGYRGIWYCNQGQKDEYVYKYSGGLGTYCQPQPVVSIGESTRRSSATAARSRAIPRSSGNCARSPTTTTGRAGCQGPRSWSTSAPTTPDNRSSPWTPRATVWIFSSRHQPAFVRVGQQGPTTSTTSTRVDHQLPTRSPGTCRDKFLFLQALYHGGRKLHFQTA